MEWTLLQRERRKKGEKESEAGWLDCEGGILPPTGALLMGSGFRRLPTKRPWRKSCAPHNNTTAPGHPHAGNLRSFPPFQGIQTHSCCQPRAPTAHSRGSWLPGGKTWRHARDKLKEIWIVRKVYSRNDFQRAYWHSPQRSAWELCVPDRFC